jgi:hypothetical protein
MKYPNLTLTTLLFLTLLFIGCKEKAAEITSDEIENPINQDVTDLLSAITGSSHYGDVNITSFNITNTTDLNADLIFTATGVLTLNPTLAVQVPDAVDGGIITFGSEDLTFDPLGEKVYRFSNSQSQNQSLKSNFGGMCNLSFGGNSTAPYGSGSSNISTPDLINFTGPFTAPSKLESFSKNQPFTITWNAQSNSQVGILLKYDGDISHLRDASLPTADIITTYVTNDNGSFTIPSADLAAIPDNGFCTIHIARGSDSDLTLSDGKEIIIHVYTVAYNPMILTR